MLVLVFFSFFLPVFDAIRSCPTGRAKVPIKTKVIRHLIPMIPKSQPTTKNSKKHHLSIQKAEGSRSVFLTCVTTSLDQKQGQWRDLTRCINRLSWDGLIRLMGRCASSRQYQGFSFFPSRSGRTGVGHFARAVGGRTVATGIGIWYWTL